MEIKFNVTGERRKELARAVSEITDQPMTYKGAPTFAYEVGEFIIDKIGEVSIPEDLNSDQVEKFLNQLSERGFSEDDSNTPRRIMIGMPIEGFTEASITNLEKIIASKASLIKKATGADTLTIKRTETTLEFPWFNYPLKEDEVFAYAQLIGTLCTAAKAQKRVNAREKYIENEKFAFRVFLIRLGFVGDEYKASRKILLRNLSGNSAFKNGKPHIESEEPNE